MQIKKFQRKIEDFVCQNCGGEVSGDGYTNHCPECLFSKHVDVNPGDRKESCGGLMEPVEIILESQKQVVLHKCLKCGFERRNKVLEMDDRDKIIEIANN